MSTPTSSSPTTPLASFCKFGGYLCFVIFIIPALVIWIVFKVLALPFTITRYFQRRAKLRTTPRLKTVSKKRPRALSFDEPASTQPTSRKERKDRITELSDAEKGIPPQELQTAVQSGILLTRIPSEIRLMIYGYVLGGRDLHVQFLRGKPQLEVIKKDGKIRRTYIRCSVVDCTGSCEVGFHDYGMKATRAQDLTSLLKTCRMVYREAIDILYSSNMFIFREPSDLSDFSEVMLPHRFARIRIVGLQIKWDDLKPEQANNNDTAGKRKNNTNNNKNDAPEPGLSEIMPDLRELRIVVMGRALTDSDADFEWVHQTFHHMPKLRVYEVWMRWDTDDIGWIVDDKGGFPFVLRRYFRRNVRAGYTACWYERFKEPEVIRFV